MEGLGRWRLDVRFRLGLRRAILGLVSYLINVANEFLLTYYQKLIHKDSVCGKRYRGSNERFAQWRE